MLAQQQKNTFENVVYASARAFHERCQPRDSRDSLFMVASEHFVKVLPACTGLDS